MIQDLLRTTTHYSGPIINDDSYAVIAKIAHISFLATLESADNVTLVCPGMEVSTSTIFDWKSEGPPDLVCD
jgi:hypothetical protein